jgi:hypothetical protein
MKKFNQYINEGIRDKMTPKEGALDKLYSLMDELIVMLLEDEYFDTYEDAKKFLTSEYMIDNLVRMKGFELNTDDIYVEITQFNLDDYLYLNNLPLKFAFDKNHKDDMSIMGSDAYNKAYKRLYYEDEQTKEEREQRRRMFNEGVRHLMTGKSEEDILKSLDKLSIKDKFYRSCEYGMFDIIKDMLDNGDITMEWKDDALTNAAWYRRFDVVKFLLDNGVPASQRAFMFGVRAGNYDIVKLFLDRGVNPYGNDSEAFRMAAMPYNKMEKIHNLLKQYGKTFEGIRDKMLPKSEEDILKSLSNLSLDEKFIKLHNNNTLHLMSNEDIKDAIKILLKVRPSYVFTTLNYKYEELSKIVTDEEIKDALSRNLKVYSNHLIGYKEEDSLKFSEIYLYLYKHGYTFDKFDRTGSFWFKHHTKDSYSGGHFSINGYSKLKDAIDYVERMEKLSEGIRDKMTPKSDDDILKSLKGLSPHQKLILGCKNDSIIAVKQAMEETDDEDLIHMDGEWPLRLAIKNNSYNVVKYLLDNGSDVHALDDDGFWLARGNREMLKLLKQYESNVLLEMNNDIDNAREVFIIINNEDELNQLKKIADELGYIWHFSVINSPCYVFFRLDNKRVLNASYNSMIHHLDNLKTDSTWNGLYTKLYTFKDIKIFQEILKSGKILPNKPNYKPKKFNKTFESNSDYPYRFKTEQEMINDYGENWMEVFGETGWNSDMNNLLGIDYPFMVDELNLDSTSPMNDDFEDINGIDWSICPKMLTKNKPTKPNYKPKKFNKTFESFNNYNYYNIISKKNTTWKYRFKTEEEFIKEFGKYWQSDVNWNSNGDMDYLFGIDFDNYLNDEGFASIRNKGFRGPYNWTICNEMLIQNIEKPNYSPKKFNRTFEKINEEYETSLIKEVRDSYYFSKYNSLLIIFNSNIEEDKYNKTIELLQDTLNVIMPRFHECHRSEEQFYVVIYINNNSNKMETGWGPLSTLIHSHFVKTYCKYKKPFYIDDINTLEKINNILKYAEIRPNYKPKKFNITFESIENKYPFNKILIHIRNEIEKEKILKDLWKLGYTWSTYKHLTEWDDRILNATRYTDFMLYVGLKNHFLQYGSNVNVVDIQNDYDPHIYTIDNWIKIKNILNYGNIPNYKPKKFNRTLESGNSAEEAREITVLIYNLDELKLLDNAIRPLGYIIPESFFGNDFRYIPINIFLELKWKSVTQTMLTPEQRKNFKNIRMLDGVWDNELTIKNLPYILRILKADKIIENKPNYKPKKFNRTIENLNESIFHPNYDYTSVVISIKNIEELLKAKNYFHYYDFNNIYDGILYYLNDGNESYIRITDNGKLTYGTLNVLETNTSNSLNTYEKVYTINDLLSGLLDNIKKYGNIKPNYKPKKFNRT